MARNTWIETLSVQGAGTAITNTTSELPLFNDVSIPAGYMVPGRILNITMAGKVSSVVTTPGTMTFRVRWGGVGGTLLVTSGALTQNVILQTDKTWFAQICVQCITDGAAGTFLTWGQMQRGNCAAAVVADMTPDLLPASGLAVVSSLDTTTVKLLSVTAQASVSTATTSIQGLGYKLASEN